ncbi:MAG: YfgM family protein [Nevskiales bacterium]
MDALNDHEQAQLLRQWWQENWLPLVLGLVLALTGVLGWQFWQSYQQGQAEAASAEYESLREALGSEPEALIDQKLARLQSDYARTPYAGLGALAVAQRYVAANALEKAQPPLSWAADKATDPGVRQLARLRLARLLWAQNQPEQALKTLSADPDVAFNALFAELRGDILLGQGKRDEARAAYEKALESRKNRATEDGAATEKGPDTSSLERKLADLRADAN